MSDTVDGLRKAGRCVVAAIASEEFQSECSFRCLQRFPVGCCKIASLLYGRFITDNGAADGFIYVSGENHEPEYESHFWIEWQHVIVDITAHQFSEVTEVVFVGHDRSWHDRVYPKQQQWSYSSAMEFNDDYAQQFDADYACLRSYTDT